MSRPIILKNVVDKEGDNSKIFEYDYLNDMNVVFIDDRKVKYLDIDNYTKELQTSTRVSREYDDEEISLLELYSKTEVIRERDDEELSLIELQTKTFVERERDDEEDINFN